jgi:hypothetical protein
VDAGFDAGFDAGYDAGPPTPCATNSDCGGGLRCLLVGSDGGISGLCGPKPGAKIPGDACGDDAECNTGLCFDNFCSALCLSRDDCGPDQACHTESLTVDTVTADVDICVTLPETSCSDQATCAPDRVCGRLDFDGSEPLDTFCAFPVEGGAGLGEACSTTGNSNECTDRVCLASLNGSCSRICTGDGDCQAQGDPNGFVCTDVDFTNNGTVRLCMEGCTVASDCGGSEVCHLTSDTPDDVWEWVCREPGTNRTQLPGEDCNNGSGQFACSTGYCFAGKCTTPCETQNDCPGTLPVCGDTNTTAPSGSGSVTLRVCRPS